MLLLNGYEDLLREKASSAHHGSVLLEYLSTLDILPLMVVACVSSLEYLSTHHDRVRVLGLGKMSYPGDGIIPFELPIDRYLANKQVAVSEEPLYPCATQSLRNSHASYQKCA